jgi:uncharacterized protein with NAD-binding domain and iron-sulfur cluster
VSRKRALVVGAGPAGLAAGVRLLEGSKGAVDVKLVHMGHHVGGKAASYTDAGGRRTEHGWHMVLGFYDRMFALMRSAGIDESRALSTMGGNAHPYEPWSGRVHALSGSGGALAFAARFAGYDGLPLGDRIHYSRFMSETFALALSGEDLTRHDDVCFSTWAIEHGLPPHIVSYSLFRMFRDLYFNFPEQVSAYHVLQTMKLTSSSQASEAFVCRGGWSELVWEPIAKHLLALGGSIEPYTMATDWIYDGRRVTGVRVARPDGAGHAFGETSWTTPRLPVEAGTERTLDDFDVVVSAIPHAVFVTMNAGDSRMWASSYFSRLRNLRSAATVSMRVTTKQPVLPFRGPVFGLPAPLGIAVNMTDHLLEKPDQGSVVAFVGQESGFEAWSDEQIASFTIDNLSRVPRVGSLRDAGIVDLELHRNRSDFERILLCEPGVQQFRPGARTPFANLFVAGDWVQNEVDVICMEGAIASGHAAADEALAALGGA